MKGIKKEREKNHWTVPYCYAGRTSKIHIWLYEEETSQYNGKYLICSGAYTRMADTFEEAVTKARRLTLGGALC